MIVRLTAVPASRVSNVALTTPLVNVGRMPESVAAETKLTPSGRVSLRMTPVAANGPALATVTGWVDW